MRQSTRALSSDPAGRPEPMLHDLQALFPTADIEWRPLAFTADRKRALAAPYLTNRAIMDRLDAVCGPAGWRNEFRAGPDGGVLCGISIRFDGEWITKWDGASNTEIEAVKGGLSSSMRRAAVQWGIGRYLYRMPAMWEPVDEKGRFVRTPRVPPGYVPNGSGDRPGSARLRPFTVVRDEGAPRPKRRGPVRQRASAGVAP